MADETTPAADPTVVVATAPTLAELAQVAVDAHTGAKKAVADSAAAADALAAAQKACSDKQAAVEAAHKSLDNAIAALDKALEDMSV